MLLQDIPEDNNLVIELSMNGQKYEFPSKVIRKVNQSVLVEPIRINGKILSFNSSGGGITVSVYMIRDSKPPMLCKGVAVNSIREDNAYDLMLGWKLFIIPTNNWIDLMCKIDECFFEIYNKYAKGDINE